MSLYGYPREPEATGDENAESYLPQPRVSSDPVSAPPGPLTPPAPLLPPDPPSTWAASTDLGSSPPQSSGWAVGEFGGSLPSRAERDAAAGMAPAGDAGSEFQWLSARSEPPASPVVPEQPGFGSPSTGQPTLGQPVSAPPGLGPSPAMGQPTLGQPAPAGFGPSPTMGQPTLGQPVSAPPGFGPSPSLGQPAVPFGQPSGAGWTDLISREPAATVADRTSSGVLPAARPTTSPGLPDAPVPGIPDGPVRRIPERRAPETAAAPTVRTTAAPRAVELPAVDEDALAALLDEDDSPPPWDRRPLLVVIVSTVVLVLIGVAAGMVSAAVFEPKGTVGASWREPDPDAPPIAPAPGDDTISLSAVGDMIMGAYGYGLPPNGAVGFFDEVKAELDADLVMGNLEQALSEPTGYSKCNPESTSCFAYSAPPSYANVLRDAGFDLVTTNNNHTNDAGPQGILNTRAALESAGVAHTGGIDQITYVTVKEVKVAVLGFAPYTWGASLNDIPRARELVTQAAAEADIVVVQFHGGAEGVDKTRVLPAGESEFAYGENRGDLRGFSHAVVEAGADLVIGHGPHVMRGMEVYQGRLIAYSLGNFCGYHTLRSTGFSGVGGILEVTLHRDGTWAGGELIATEMIEPGTPAIDTDLRALAFVDNLSEENFGAAGVRIDHTTGKITVPA